MTTATAKAPAGFTDYIVADIGLADFGRAPQNDGGFSWERTDLAPQLKSALA